MMVECIIYPLVYKYQKVSIDYEYANRSLHGHSPDARQIAFPGRAWAQGILSLPGSQGPSTSSASGADPFGSTAATGTGGPAFDLYQVGIDASWEIDPWGKARATRRADALAAAYALALLTGQMPHALDTALAGPEKAPQWQAPDALPSDDPGQSAPSGLRLGMSAMARLDTAS